MGTAARAPVELVPVNEWDALGTIEGAEEKRDMMSDFTSLAGGGKAAF